MDLVVKCNFICNFEFKVKFSLFQIQFQTQIQIQVEIPISDFGVTMAILNPVDIFRSLCKLSFGPIKVQVKSRHFSKKDKVSKLKYNMYF